MTYFLIWSLFLHENVPKEWIFKKVMLQQEDRNVCLRIGKRVLGFHHWATHK